MTLTAPEGEQTIGQACYVYGIVDADADADATLPPLTGVRDAEVITRRDRDLAAVVSDASGTVAPLGSRDDLLAHDHVVSALVAAGIAVLPMRFGALVAGAAAISQELIGGHYDELRAALDQIRGCTQFTVQVRYDQDRALRKVIERNPQLAAQRGAGGYGERIRLGERVVAGLDALRRIDASRLCERLGHAAAAVHVREPADPCDVLDAAFLVPDERQEVFLDEAEHLAQRHHRRMRFRALGPQACYDFVPGGR